MTRNTNEIYCRFKDLYYSASMCAKTNWISVNGSKKKGTWGGFEVNISDYPTVYAGWDLPTYQAPQTKMKSVVNIKYLKSIALNFLKRNRS